MKFIKIGYSALTLSLILGLIAIGVFVAYQFTNQKTQNTLGAEAQSQNTKSVEISLEQRVDNPSAVNVVVRPTTASTYISFVKATLYFDNTKIKIVEDPKFSRRWGNPIYSTPLSTANGLSRITLAASILTHQDPISARTVFATIKFAKVNPNAGNVKTVLKIITLQSNQSQVIATPAQETALSTVDLEISL